MTIGMLRGVNKAGHRGWITEKCIMCATKLDFYHAYDSKNIYYCPRCIETGLKAYFCIADAKKVHYRCPYCRSELKSYY